MIPQQFYYQLVVLGLLWLCVMLHLGWPSRDVTPQTKPAKPITPRRQRSTEPKSFAGLTHKPPCALVSKKQHIPKRPLPYDSTPCPRPTGGPGRWIRPCTFVPTAVVAIAAG